MKGRNTPANQERTGCSSPTRRLRIVGERPIRRYCQCPLCYLVVAYTVHSVMWDKVQLAVIVIYNWTSSHRDRLMSLHLSVLIVREIQDVAKEVLSPVEQLSNSLANNKRKEHIINFIL